VDGRAVAEMTIAQATDLIMNGYKALAVSLTATPIKPMGKNPRMGLVLDQCKGGIIKIKSFVPIFFIGLECICEADRWFNTMDSRTACGTW